MVLQKQNYFKSPVKELEDFIKRISSKEALINSNKKKGNGIIINSNPRYGKYIKIDGVLIAIDHWNPEADIIYISHAHMDHIPNFSKKVQNKVKNEDEKKWFVCSRITKTIAEFRTRNKFTFPDSCWLLGKDLKKKNSVEFKGVQLNLIENGHTYGSTSLLIEGSETILYTSDFTGEDKIFGNDITPLKHLQPIKCDRLIMECTYGTPKYIFPSYKEIKSNLKEYLDSNLKINRPVIILAYSFGKSQILLNTIEMNSSVILERSIYNHVEILEDLGIIFREWEPYGNYNKNQLIKLKKYVLIIPPYFMFQEPYKTLISNGAQVLYATGKGLNEAEKEKFLADYYLLYSDHCSFNQLINFVDQCKSGEIYLEHGQINEFTYFIKNNLYFSNINFLI